jgi:hypothetical protein
MGTDMGRFQNQGEVTQFLLEEPRDQMRDQRRQRIAAVLGNNMSQAMKIKANYERQFGMPLTVTQQQMREAVKVREGSIASRTMNSMDKDLQQQYRDVLAQTVPDALTPNAFPVEQGAMYVCEPAAEALGQWDPEFHDGWHSMPPHRPEDQAVHEA